jgi:hypothetical protein
MTDPLLELEIGIVGGIISALVVAALLKLWSLPGKVVGLEKAMEPLVGIPGKVSKMEGELEVLVALNTRGADLIEAVKKLGKPGSNPYILNRRNELLDRYQLGTITVQEAGELADYLQEDVNRLRGAGDVVGTVQATGVMIGLEAYRVAQQTAGAVQATLRRLQPPQP